MSLMYQEMGLKVVSALSDFSTSRHEAKMDAISRKYQQTMADISAAQQMNTMTENEISARDAGIRAAVAIGTQSLKDRAGAVADAAAAGVQGGSVRSSMRGLMRSRLMAKQSLRKKLEANARSFQNDRRNLALSRVMNRDISPLSKPSATHALLGLGASMVDIWDSHQPDGSKISDSMSRKITDTTSR